EQAGRFRLRQRTAVDLDRLAGLHDRRRAVEAPALQGHTAGGDQRLGVAARAEARARDDLGDALAFGRLAPRVGAGCGRRRLGPRFWSTAAQIRFSSKSAQEWPKATSPSSRKSA